MIVIVMLGGMATHRQLRAPAALGAWLKRLIASKLREGMFDEYVGEYRFAARPDLVVRILREGSALVSYGGGQRAVLASLDDDTLVATEFDGEGRFQRDRSGHVVRFVYYEFGARLGIATKTTANRGASPPSNQA